MPKQIDWEPIRKYWEKTGDSSAAIALKFAVSKRAVDERIPHWRSTRPEVETKPVPPKVRARQARAIDEMDIIEVAISDLAAVLGSGETEARSLGSIATALVRLLEYRRKVQPPTAVELAEQVLALGVSPAEFARELREQWQLRA